MRKYGSMKIKGYREQISYGATALSAEIKSKRFVRYLERSQPFRSIEMLQKPRQFHTHRVR